MGPPARLSPRPAAASRAARAPREDRTKPTPANPCEAKCADPAPIGWPGTSFGPAAAAPLPQRSLAAAPFIDFECQAASLLQALDRARPRGDVAVLDISWQTETRFTRRTFSEGECNAPSASVSASRHCAMGKVQSKHGESSDPWDSSRARTNSSRAALFWEVGGERTKPPPRRSSPFIVRLELWDAVSTASRSQRGSIERSFAANRLLRLGSNWSLRCTSGRVIYFQRNF